MTGNEFDTRFSNARPPTLNPVGTKDAFELPARILVVEDDPFLRSVIQAVLMPAGATSVVMACASGQEALAVAADFRPDLVLLDFVMPGLDGPATWSALRGRLEPIPPVIFLTARKGPDVEVDLAAGGAAGLIAKPFDPLTLRAQIHRLLAGVPANPAAITPPPDTARRMAAVAADFRASLPAAAQFLDSLAEGLRAPDPQSQTVAAVLAKAHTLAGSAGLFGYHAVGAAAEEVERLLLDVLKAEKAPPAHGVDRIVAAVTTLAAACRAA